MRTCLGLMVLFGLVSPLTAAEKGEATSPGEARLLRFPTIHDNQIAFTYAGDLYTVSASGGVARKLTGHEGFEMFPHFSPDGKWLAFTGQYDGNTEVYVIPAEGGVPRRLTYTATLARDDVSDRMGPNNIVMGWQHDSKHIVFRSRMASFNDFLGQLYLVSLDGGLPEPLPLPRGGFCSFSPDDKKLAYNRVFREFRTWKRYRGGMADNVWIYDFDAKKVENLTGPTVVASLKPGEESRTSARDVPANGQAGNGSQGCQDIIPMWSGNRIYFLSDRGPGQRMNLYVQDLGDHKVRPLTTFADFDVKFPSLGDRAIVFENGGWIYRFDLDSEKCEKVSVRIPDDHAGGRGGLVNVSKSVNRFYPSPDGKRALFVARGDVFTVPAHSGPTRNLTATSGAHERNAEWSPDGKLIAYVSDATGEDEIHVQAADGSAPPRQLTTGGDTYKFEIAWSPDSKKILWSDKKLRLQYVEVATKAVKPVAQAKAFEIRQFEWSPDSRWIAYAMPERIGNRRVYLFSTETGKTVPVTDAWYDANSPAFSSDGKYLFFASGRDFNPVFSATEFNHAYQDMERIYLVTLARETPSPFRPKNDEAGEPDKPKGADDGKKEVVVKVDPEGLTDRTFQVPVQPANYRNLVSVGNTLYYIRQGSKDAKPAFQLYDLGQRKETALGSVNAFVATPDGKKFMVLQDGKYGIVDAPKAPVTLTEPLDLSNLEVKLDRHQEWNQIYHECWRQMRDFFYDPGMHGVDWKKIGQRYEPLVAHVNHRADLTYVIGEMIGELNVGHAYVGGGEMPHAARVQMGLLGARLERDPSSGYYRIAKLLHGATWNPALRSPLAEPGVDAKEGDFLIAINGQRVNEMANPYEALQDKAGKQVFVRINSEPKEKGSREVLVVPVASEADLYYEDWIQTNRKKVSDATGGKVGYVHIPDMQVAGLNAFARQFYPQVDKKALIVDVRGNGGGNVSAMIMERLRRHLDMVGVARNTTPNTDPGPLVNGPMVCLLNEFSASDGDLFPYRFRQAHLGKLVGKRSWGGVVGIRNPLPLLDGSQLSRPEFARYDVEGKNWVIEGHGVDPDIVVDNDPAHEYAGVDDQLNKAIAVILEELKTKDKDLPSPPPYPKK